MQFLPVWDISASGLEAEQFRMDLIASNIANVQSTRTAEGGPYRRRVAVFSENLAVEAANGFPGRGVKVDQVVEDSTPPQLVYDPAHPDADSRGNVSFPNVNMVNEMVDLLIATRSYEANVTVLNAAKTMALKSLELGRG